MSKLRQLSHHSGRGLRRAPLRLGASALGKTQETARRSSVGRLLLAGSDT